MDILYPLIPKALSLNSPVIQCWELFYMNYAENFLITRVDKMMDLIKRTFRFNSTLYSATHKTGLKRIIYLTVVLAAEHTSSFANGLICKMRLNTTIRFIIYHLPIFNAYYKSNRDILMVQYTKVVSISAVQNLSNDRFI